MKIDNFEALKRYLLEAVDVNAMDAVHYVFRELEVLRRNKDRLYDELAISNKQRRESEEMLKDDDTFAAYLPFRRADSELIQKLSDENYDLREEIRKLKGQ